MIVHRTATIANGESLSDAIILDEGFLVGLILPATWTTANLTLQAAGENDESTFQNVYDQAGTEVTITAAASRYVILEPAKFAGIKKLKIRSGTSGTPVAQAAARSIVAILASEG
jgi:hypothetical protein